MSDREAILRALREIQRRLRLNRTLHESALLLGMVALGVLVWRLLRVFGGRLPAASAAVVLAALLLWLLGAFLLARSRFRSGVSLGTAAAMADDRARLKDELKTAYWFLDHPLASPWIAAQVARAARSAQRLNSAALLPIRLEWRTLVGGALTVLVLAVAWVLPPLAPTSQAVAQPGGALSPAEAQQAQLIRDLLAQAGDPGTVEKLEKALRALERTDARDEERRRALAAAQQAVEQQKLQAASTREGLYQLSEKLRGNRALGQVADALAEGDARKAGEVMRQAAESGSAGAGHQPSTSVDQRESEKDLERLLQEAGKGEQRGPGREIASAAGKQAVDRLNKIAEQLDAQARLSQAAQALHELQLAVAQRSQLSAGRFGQEAAHNSTASPDTGQTVMPGGTMYRAAAVARESKASAQQEGTKAGSAIGDSEAEPVLGSKTTPLEVQLKQEGVTGERADERAEAARSWYYTQSKEQESVLELQQAPARASFAQAEASAGEGISIRHRQIVKDYFMNLREDAR